MATDDDVDTSRTSVKTYVPAYQKTRWKEHADELGMSQSEFVRSMVQAGRRSFGASDEEIDAITEQNTRGSRPENSGAETGQNPTETTNGRSELADRVVALLKREQTLSWDQLVEELTDDIEERLDETLGELQDESRVRYSGRNGGYTLSGNS